MRKTVPKKAPAKPAKTRADAGPEADPRFFPVANAFLRTPGFSLMESKSGALRGLMLNGKSFGMSSHGRFILKLNEERAKALIEEGIGKPFGHGAGKVIGGWIEVTHAKADWVALAKEAHRLAATSKSKPSAPRKPKR